MIHPYKQRPIDNEQNKPRRIARATFELLKQGPAPTVILSKDKDWEVSVLPRTVIVPSDSLKALKYGMVRAAMEEAVDEMHREGKRKPGFMDRLELMMTRQEIGRFVKEVARSRQE